MKSWHVVLAGLMCVTIGRWAQAAHPLLADASDNLAWHAPETSDEMVFVGANATNDASLTLKKAAMQSASAGMPSLVISAAFSPATM